MAMCLALHSVSDENITSVLKQPELIWKLIAADDPQIYEQTIKENNSVGFISRLLGKQAPEDIEIPDLNFVEGENVDHDLDKFAWQNETCPGHFMTPSLCFYV